MDPIHVWGLSHRTTSMYRQDVDASQPSPSLPLLDRGSRRCVTRAEREAARLAAHDHGQLRSCRTPWREAARSLPGAPWFSPRSAAPSIATADEILASDGSCSRSGQGRVARPVALAVGWPWSCPAGRLPDLDRPSPAGAGAAGLRAGSAGASRRRTLADLLPGPRGLPTPRHLRRQGASIQPPPRRVRPVDLRAEQIAATYRRRFRARSMEHLPAAERGLRAAPARSRIGFAGMGIRPACWCTFEDRRVIGCVRGRRARVCFAMPSRSTRRCGGSTVFGLVGRARHGPARRFLRNHRRAEAAQPRGDRHSERARTLYG